jgi:hypothetical protein
MRRRSLPVVAGLHWDGHAAPAVLLLADRPDDAGAHALRSALERLHGQGELNFSFYVQADVDLAGPAGWARWIRERRPATLLLARPGRPGDQQVIDYCHNRGVAVVCHQDGTVPSGPRNGRRAEARDAVLAACDLVCAATPELAADLQRRHPAQRVVVLAGPASSDAFARQLLDIAVRKARRSAWQKAAGTVRRACAVAGNLARVVLQRAWGPVQREGDPQRARLRVLFVANSYLPTLQLCFTSHLQPLTDANAIAWELLADIQLHRAGRVLSGGRARWARRRIARFQPQLVVFCRYSGAHARLVTDWARARGVPTIFHVDDDLLDVPKELGPEKYAFHNHPARLAAVRHLLDTVDLVYCSTEPLLDRMRGHGFRGEGLAARVHCPGEVLRDPPKGEPLVIGYMGIDHAHDFQVALPALVRILERNPQVRFEIFGPIAMPVALERFGDRITRVAFVRSYDQFLATFARLDWAIGICPLADTPFNRFKANNKWVEYTSVGIATVATAGMLYDACCADGCGLLAADDAQWEASLQSLIDEPLRRMNIVAAAQERLRREYSPHVLREQIQEIFQSVLAQAGRPTVQAARQQQAVTVEAIRGD